MIRYTELWIYFLFVIWNRRFDSYQNLQKVIHLIFENLGLILDAISHIHRQTRAFLIFDFWKYGLFGHSNFNRIDYSFQSFLQIHDSILRTFLTWGSKTPYLHLSLNADRSQNHWTVHAFQRWYIWQAKNLILSGSSLQM